MAVTVLMLVVGALFICAGGIVKIFRALQLDPMHTLMWIGLAEEPLPQVAERRR